MQEDHDDTSMMSEVHFLRGRALMGDGQYRNAAEEFQQVLAHSPNSYLVRTYATVGG